MNHRPHFPITLLTLNGNFIVAAALAHPEVPARLPANYIADTETLVKNTTTKVSGQKKAKADAGNLTKAQSANLETLQLCMNQARKTAKLAFPGQTVKLHQEFQIGAHDKHDLGAILGRGDIILASVASNLPALKLKGWTDAETQAFAAARGTFGPATTTKEKGKSDAKTATTQKALDAATLYEHVLTIQNAADLQWPATNPANAGVRDEFRLNTFPPANHAPPPALPAAPPAEPGK